MAWLGNYANDAELNDIAQALQDAGPGLLATITRNSHHYSHEHTVTIDVENEDGDTAPQEEAVAEALRDFMRWIYRALEREHDWRNDDAQVDESLIANEYHFNEDGKID